MYDEQLVIKISKRFFFTLALLGFFALVSFLIFFSKARQLESDVPVIRLNGQQQVLVQKIKNLLYQLSDEQDKNIRQRLLITVDSTLNNLEKGHNRLAHSEYPDTETHSGIYQVYFDEPYQLDKHIHEFITIVRALVNSSAEKPVYSLSEPAYQQILSALQLTDEFYITENNNEMATLKWKEFLIFISTIVLLFLIWKLVFKPARRELRNNISELIKKDNDLLEVNKSLEKKVEDRAREILSNENKYKRLVENMNEGVAHYTLDGIFTFVNDKYCEILGYTREELIDQPIFKLFYEQDVPLIKAKIDQRKKRVGEKYEWVLPRKDGQKIWVSVSSSTIIEEKDVSGVMVVITDITEKKESELLLAELNSFNETLIQTIPLGMQVVDTEGNVLFANNIVKEMAGYDPVGKKCWTVIHDEKTACSNCLRSKGIKQGVFNICELQQVFDGKTMHIYQSGINYHNTMAALEIYVDITQLKESQQRVNEKNKELQVFFSRASHDMRTPLANILGLVSILQKKSCDQERQTIDFIKTSALKMDSILLDLINLGKVYQDPLKIEPVNFSALIDAAYSSVCMEKSRDAKFISDIRISTDFHSDTTLLRSIFRNLFDNALHYRNLGAEDATIHVTVHESKSGISIMICDNGQGMNQEVQQRAFEMFYRGNLASKGAGLGLYMVKTYVEKLEGTIKLNSRPGIGTDFSITLPNLEDRAG